MRTEQQIHEELRRYERITQELTDTGTPNIIIYIIGIKLSALRWVLEMEKKL